MARFSLKCSGAGGHPREDGHLPYRSNYMCVGFLHFRPQYC